MFKRQIDIQTDREIDIHIDRQIDIQIPVLYGLNSCVMFITFVEVRAFVLIKNNYVVVKQIKYNYIVVKQINYNYIVVYIDSIQLHSCKID